MKILLTAVNAKFIHTCTAIACLRSYALSHGGPLPEISLVEYTINDRYEDILLGLLEQRADVYAFSTYIWNVDRCLRLIRDLKRVLEDGASLWAGGPEASHRPEIFLENGADLCLLGEGEETFAWLSRQLAFLGKMPDKASLARRPGFAFQSESGVTNTGMAPCVELDEIPFLYENLEDFSHRILYYESSRGCPFACAYCLSGKERGLRYRSLEKVKAELSFFLDHGVDQVKFIDRTFNADPERAIAIWTYLQEHDNGTTNFHFEIEARRMTREGIGLLKALRPGLVQLEIGVQSTNEETLRSVCRSGDLMPVRELMAELVPLQNINLHLDLIAGLPYEGLESFRRSFCQVYALRPHQFQVGFLKLLPGTSLYERQRELGLVASTDAPYEILKTRWLSFEDLILLHRISDAVEIYVNSMGFRHCLPLIEELFEDAFSLFSSLSDFLRKKGYQGNTPSLQNRYSLLEDFVRLRAASRQPEKERVGKETGEQDGKTEKILEAIRFDRLLHVHASRRMQAAEELDLGEGPALYHFDYQHLSPVNQEASWRKEEGSSG